jgi:hypothetical protein
VPGGVEGDGRQGVPERVLRPRRSRNRPVRPSADRTRLRLLDELVAVQGRLEPVG